MKAREKKPIPFVRENLDSNTTSKRVFINNEWDWFGNLL